MIIILIHTVKKGETLYSIGRNYGYTVYELINANGDTVADSLAVGQAVIIPTPNENISPAIINGYAYPYIKQSSVYGYSPVLSLVSPFSHGITANGELLPLEDDDLLALISGLSIKPLLLVTSLTEAGMFSSERIADVLSSKTSTLINSIIKTLETADYFGVDIDFEYIPPEFRQAYIDFIAELKSKLSPLNYKIFVSLAPKTSSTQRGLLYESHDYSQLAKNADFLLIMTYEWGYTYGPPMAIAPIDKVEQVINYAVTEMPSEKILLGIPNYAYDWTLPFVKGSSAARSMTNENAVNLAKQKGAEIMFDVSSQTPYFEYTENGAVHQVWFEDARSIQARCDLIKKYSLAGGGIWNIMAFYKPLETTVKSNFKKTNI